MPQDKRIGATYIGDNKTEFWVFAPFVQQVAVNILKPVEQRILLTPQHRGYHHGIVENVEPGATYQFSFNGQEFADPASRFQPDGVFGPSQVVDPQFEWTDHDWHGLRLTHYIIYECHVGVITSEGTFKAIIPLLDDLCDLGITALEIMPIAQFCGKRNWGYDGVFPFAPQNTYGSPQDLKELVNACHQKGLAVILDVIYNHMGPEGNILGNYGPYFTDRYKTPWGSAINFDGPYSDAVRYFFLQNACMWLREYHFDALRLDALHSIFDYSAYHFLAELSDHVHRLAHQSNRHIYLIAESALNDAKLIRTHQNGGYAIDSQWNDDFHHALHALLTQEKYGYYLDFGGIEQMIKALREGYVLTGQYSQYWLCRHGGSSESIPAEKFVVFSQNHDHVGNRLLGERLSQLVNFEQTKLAAAMVLLSPFIPLLFMGEEYAETAPFLYFTDYQNPVLIQAVSEGRKADLKSQFGSDTTPNPQEESSFFSSKMNWNLRGQDPHNSLYRFYQKLIQLRKTIPGLKITSKNNYHVESSPQQKIIFLRRWDEDDHETFIIFNFMDQESSVLNPVPAGIWRKILDSADPEWHGPGGIEYSEVQVTKTMIFKLAPYSVLVFDKVHY